MIDLTINCLFLLDVLLNFRTAYPGIGVEYVSQAAQKTLACRSWSVTARRWQSTTSLDGSGLTSSLHCRTTSCLMFDAARHHKVN
eukprot:93663-Chlamydomonas_euryale.AAC.1